MSYGFTCYYNNAGIASTKVYSEYATQSWQRSYGDDALTVTGFVGDLIFHATPATGYVFKRWCYHVGAVDAPLQYSYDNPFVYHGTEDIIIRAEVNIPILRIGGMDVTQYLVKDGINSGQTERNTKIVVTMDGSLRKLAQLKKTMSVALIPVSERVVSLLQTELMDDTVAVTLDGVTYQCYHKLNDIISSVVGATTYHRISIVFEEV